MVLWIHVTRYMIEIDMLHILKQGSALIYELLLFFYL